MQNVRDLTLRYSRPAVQAIFDNCRKRAPDATAEELFAVILAMAKMKHNGFGIRDEVAVVRDWSQTLFTAAEVEDYRREEPKRRAMAEAKSRREQEEADLLRRHEEFREQQLKEWLDPASSAARAQDRAEREQQAREEEAAQKAAQKRVETEVRNWLMDWFEDHPNERTVKFWELRDELQTPAVREFVMRVGGKREDWVQQRKAASG